MQIQVIANCQARPVSAQIGRVAPDIRILEPIILHLSKAEQKAEQLAQIAQADVIFAQLTQDGFQPAHLASADLKERFGDKVLIWPNIFYTGQQPYLRYFTHPKLGRLMGPLEALHDIRLYRSWKHSGRVDPNVLDHSDPAFIASTHALSIAELEKKEARCHVTISDFLAANADNQRLFFTFNHPSQLVLAEMARRLLHSVGLDTDPQDDRSLPEPLARYQVPSVWSANEAVFQGDACTVDADNTVLRLGRAPRRYTREELCSSFQEIYDANDIYQTFNGVRLTPSILEDGEFLSKIGRLGS